jgi:hypothetical protein
VLARQIGGNALFIVGAKVLRAVAPIGPNDSSLTITAYIVLYCRQEFADLGLFACIAADGD